MGCLNIHASTFFTGQYNPVGPKDSQSLTLCLNSTKIVETLEDVLVKSRAMYDAGAYLHWFWKHGCSKVKSVVTLMLLLLLLMFFFSSQDLNFLENHFGSNLQI